MPQLDEQILAALTAMNGGQPPAISMPAAPMQNTQTNGLLGQIVGEVANKKQEDNSATNSIMSILSQRFQPTMADTAMSLRNGVASMAPAFSNLKRQTPEEIAQERAISELAPYTTALGLQEKLADVAMKQAHAKFYGNQGGGGVLGAQVQMLMQDNPGMSYTQAFQLAQTGLRQGVMYDPSGKMVAIPGMAEAKGALKYGETAGKEGAETAYAAPKASATAQGKETGESIAKLQEMQAFQPGLEKTISELHDLGQKATYTYAGRGRDIVVRQLGGATEGAKAREEYINKVNDQLLPLLRQTFGAQFTLQEGENLKATLGDPNKSPPEKDAALRAFITQKQRTIEALQKRTGSEGIKINENEPPPLTSDPLGIR